MPRVRVGDVHLHYEEQGTGECLLLLSGTAGGCGLWRRHQVPAFSRRFRTISLDYRGVGRSDRPEEPYSTRLLAHDAIGLMDALGIERFHVMGHSMGGAMAQWIALDAPDRVRSLILASCGGFFDPTILPARGLPLKLVVDLVEKGYERRMRDHYSGPFWFPPEFARQHPEVVQATVEELVSELPPLPFYLRHVMARQEHDLTDQLSEIRCRTLVMVGSEETITDRTMPILRAGQYLSSHIPGAQLLVIDGCAHGYFQQAPDVANHAVMQFLRAERNVP